MVTMTDLHQLGACHAGRTFAAKFIKGEGETLGVDEKDIRALRGLIKRVYKARIAKYKAGWYTESFVTKQAEERVGTYLSTKWNHVSWYLGKVATDSEVVYHQKQYELHLAQLCRLLGIPEGESYLFSQKLALRIMNCTNDEAIALAAALNLWLNGLPLPHALLRNPQA